MKKSIDFSFDDHPEDDDEKARVAWAVAAWTTATPATTSGSS